MTRPARSLPRRLALALVLLALAACAAPPRLSASDGRAETAFQSQIDALGYELDLPRTGKAVIVNVPAFELLAVEDGEPVLRSRIIVGTRWNPTPLIDTYTTVVRFRPTWRPTPAMIASGEYADRIWPPGPDNPLGLAAVRLAPGLLVYLHDTNQRHLFEREMRALSHGCIRVQRWDDLIAWLLDIDAGQVHAMAAIPTTRDVPTPRVPVLIRYMTVFPDARGQLVEHPDIYGLGTAARGGLRTGSSGAPPTCGTP